MTANARKIILVAKTLTANALVYYPMDDKNWVTVKIIVVDKNINY